MSRYVISDEPVSLDRLKEMLDRAFAEVSALCHGKRWRMCVPVDSDDSDIVIGDALRRASAFVSAYQEHVAAPLPASAARQEWQPIETAPTDGTHVVLFGTLWNDPDQRPRACVSWYCRRREDSPAHALGWFFSAPGYSNGFNPTHWAPLPRAAALRGIAAPPPDQEPTHD